MARRTLLLVALLLAACGGGAQELLDTARLEETQNNSAHARELYAEVLSRYHGTPQAAEAARRLAELNRAP